jgi:hypothetical protein
MKGHPRSRVSSVKSVHPRQAAQMRQQAFLSIIIKVVSASVYAEMICSVAPSSKVVVKSGLPGTPTDWEDTSDDDRLQPANPTPTMTSRGAGYNPSPTRYMI